MQMIKESERPSVTLREVARLAGVSPATASRALSPGARTVRAEARERVVEAAESLGYRPNLTAKATATGTTQTIAVMVSDIRDPYYTTIAQGLIEGAAAAGLIVTLVGTSSSTAEESSLLHELRGLSPRMVVLTGNRVGNGEARQKLVQELSHYKDNGGRVVVVGQDELPFDTVVLGHEAGAAELAQVLVTRGYRNPVLLGPPENSANSTEWERGFIKGAQAAGIEMDPTYVHRAPFSRDGAYETVRRLARHGLGNTDLIVAASDLMAIGTLSALRDSGIEPGRDVAVAGFDNIVGAQDVTPELTTIDLGLQEAGAAALALGLHQSHQRQILTIPTELIIRDSTPSR